MIENQEKLSKEVKRKILFQKIFQKYSMYLILAAMLVYFAITTNGTILSFSNIINMIKQTSPIALIAMGVTMIIITTGIDLSTGSVLALAAVTAAKFAQVGVEGVKGISGLPFIVPIVMGLVIATLAGFVNGLIITKTGIPPFIATLGMYTSARGLALVVSNGGSISNLHPGFKFIGQGNILGIPTPIWILAVMAIISHIILSKTRMGRYAFAIGGNTKAAQVSGINTNKYLIMIYSYTGLLAGISGIVVTGLINSAQPTLGVLYELDAIASSVIGGTSLYGGIGSIPAALTGAFLVGLLKNGMSLQYISSYWQQIAQGIVIVIAVVLDVRKQKQKIV